MSLLEPSTSYKPFKYPWAIVAAADHEKIHWHAGEVDLKEDVSQWKQGIITDIEKNLITQILNLFTQSDVQVANNYIDFLLPTFKNNEIRHALLSFSAREGEHQRSYALIPETLGFPDKSFEQFISYKEMTNKLDFMKDIDVSTNTGKGLALAQFVFTEGVSLFGSFVMLLNFQRFGKMRGMCEVVEWSIRDETEHVEFNSRLFRQFCDEYPEIVTDEFKFKIYEMARAVEKLESNFIDLAFEMGDVDGLTKEETKSYVRYLIDRRLLQLGLKPNFGVKDNPLPWLDWIISGDSFKNFFEGRVTDYSSEGLIGDDWGYDRIYA
jgi:glutaredoxin 3